MSNNRPGIPDDDKMEVKPRINKSFPIEEPNDLSPPFVHSPLYICGQAVYVSGYVPGATVQVFANGTLIGQANSHFGFKTVELNRPLEAGLEITATQEVNGIESSPSLPVEVEPFEGTLHAPRIARDCFECGKIVDVGNVVPGSRIEVFENGSLVGTKSAANNYHPVQVKPLTANAKVTARLVRCPNGPGSEVEGPESEPRMVQPEPSPVTPPRVQQPKVGNDTVVLNDLYIGANVDIMEQGTSVIPGNYLANESANVFPIQPPVRQHSDYASTQELCKQSRSSHSVPSTSVDLEAPTVREPICPGAQYVSIGNTEINATVVLFVDGQIAGYGGAVNGELILGIGGGNRLQGGQKVEALQYMGSTIGPKSTPAVMVASGQHSPADVEIIGERMLIDPQTEKQFTGIVREESAGVTIRAKVCCKEGGVAEFFDPNGERVATVELKRIYSGYYKARWNWNDKGEKLEPGTYTVLIRTKCEQDPGKAEFEVVIGTPNSDDPTPPNVRLEANIDGNIYTLSNTDQDPLEVTAEQSQGVDIDVSVVGSDPQGLKRVELITRGAPSGSIHGTTSLRVPGRAPIPTELALNPTIRNVQPQATVILRGEAQNFSGNQNIAESSTPKLLLTIKEPSPPPSVSLTAAPSLIGPSSNARLEWQAMNASELNIDQGIGSVQGSSGSLTVNPSNTTTYRIEATGPGGRDSDTAKIRVRNQIRETTTLPLFHIGRVYSSLVGGDVEVWRQNQPIELGLNNTGLIMAMTQYGDHSRVTGIENASSYDAVVYHEYNNRWRTSELLSPGDVGSALNGQPYIGAWELYTNPLAVPPDPIYLRVSWELDLP